jgi:hypothetical protein
MTKYKVAELQGALLDDAVAKARGSACPPHPGDSVSNIMNNLFDKIVDEQHIGTDLYVRQHGQNPAPDSMKWVACMDCTTPGENFGALVIALGPTRRIAAMRCYLVNEFGDEVEL